MHQLSIILLLWMVFGWIFVMQKDVSAKLSLSNQWGLKENLQFIQIKFEPIHRAYNPTDEELIWAKGVLKASETAGTGAFNFEGKMVDAPVLARAKSIIEREV